ncbi:MAG: DegT/DnrJ/EryC1/StrS aminotransferase family protein [Planctomycetaceae bacterium]|nr:DegT/DnrJ/EryC1/StrS aminotransferase family protein [Planctomycetaceae bacterium]
MRADFLKFNPLKLGEEEIAEVVDTLRSEWITTGPKTKRFEEDFVRQFDCKSAVALASCTAGLHLALAALGIGKRDEVITTCMTFTATANVIEHVGATPVLVDVEPDTLNLDLAQVEAAITPRTKVIMPVHYAGHPVEMDALRALAEPRGITILEDAAHAVGATYRGRPIGSGENPCAFSFYATKNLTTAEGGMLTGSAELMDKARILGLHGMSRDAWKRYSKSGSWFYEVLAPGFKYNMTDIQASLGLWQLKKLAGFQQRRAEIAAAYTKAFSACDLLETPVVRPHVGHAWHLYVLRLKSERLSIARNRFIDEMTARNIGTSVHFIPIHLHPYYRETYGYSPEDFPVALDAYHRMLSLPLHPGLTDADVADVIEAVLDIATKNYVRRAA